MERRREAIMAAARAQLVANKGRRAEVFDDLEIRARVNGVEREYRLSDAPDSVVMAASSGTRSHGHATVMGMRPTFKHSKQAEAAVGFVSRRFGDGARWADIPERHREGIVDARVERMVSIEHGVVHINTRAEETAQRLRDLEYARYEQSARDMRELGGAGYALDESDDPGGMWAPDAPDEGGAVRRHRRERLPRQPRAGLIAGPPDASGPPIRRRSQDAPHDRRGAGRVPCPPPPGHGRLSAAMTESWSDALSASTSRMRSSTVPRSTSRWTTTVSRCPDLFRRAFACE